MPIDLILGTAGHIDHGKSALIHALTGCRTDRLPEEKRRGITIDLGFAELDLADYRLGIVDVPGHERFVRNMLAGATGMDLALLVVAADDSVKPQTMEHLQILNLLELPAGVIAVTKADLVSPEWLKLVQEEIRALVAESFLADAPMIPTSVITGQGLDVLKLRLRTAAEQAARSRAHRLGAPLRMAIDRVFSVPGHGVVVTGSVSSGRSTVGDEVEIQPGGWRVRIRGLQNHDRPVDQVHRGQRAAMNLSGIRLEQLERGHELAQPGHLYPTRLVTVAVRLHPRAKPLKDRSRCRIHLGSAEFLGRLRWLFQDRCEPGQVAWGQCYLDREAVAVWRQPFVLRSESPVATLGGGIIVDPQSVPLKKPGFEEEQRLGQLLSAAPQERAAAACYFLGLRSWTPADLHRIAGIEQPEITVTELLDDGVLETVPLTKTRTQLIHREVLERVWRRVESALNQLHDSHPLRTTFEYAAVRHAARLSHQEPLFAFLVKQARQRNQLRGDEDRIGLSSRGPELSQNETKLLAQLISWYRDAGFVPPTRKEIQQRAVKNQASVPQLLTIATENGDLVQLNDELYLHVDVERVVRQQLSGALTTAMTRGEGMTLSEIRELLGTTRKYAVPYCEYLDRMGVTQRDRDVRYLAVEPDVAVPNFRPPE
jgi:selenocysteine-specific elongation factor